MRVGILVGSLSQQAYTLKIAQYLAQQSTQMQYFNLDYSQLPLYNPDLDLTARPVAWTAWRKVVAALDGLIIVMPEYNLSIPGGLKNALDILSVPMPNLPAQGKPVLVISASSGSRGGMLANAHLHQVLENMGLVVLPGYVTIGNVMEIFDENQLVDTYTKQVLATQLASLQSQIYERQMLQAQTQAFQEQFALSEHRLTLLEQGRAIAYADLRHLTGGLAIDHLVVQPDRRGKGVAQRVMHLLMAIARNAGYQVHPYCSYAQAFLAQHLEYQTLVATDAKSIK